jgi:hypothetical protein
MAELVMFVLCGLAGMCAGAALGLGIGWLLGIRLFETGEADDPTSDCGRPRTTLATKVLMIAGGILGTTVAILLDVSAKVYGW